MAKTREDWLMAGLELIAKAGSQNLKIERICQDLGVTKGSFYHHFSNLLDYENSLLAFYEQVSTLNIIQDLSQIPDPRVRLRTLLEHITQYAPDVEIALRGWATQDPRAAQLQQKLDQLREGYVHSLMAEIFEDPLEASRAARASYWMFVGSQQALFKHDPQQKKEIHLMLLDRLGI